MFWRHIFVENYVFGMIFDFDPKFNDIFPIFDAFDASDASDACVKLRFFSRIVGCVGCVFGPPPNPSKLLSSFFLNIDGNSTNFNHLLVILKSISYKFKAIGLAETNTSPQESKPFSIPEYVAHYQDTREGKKSGTILVSRCMSMSHLTAQK